MSIFKIKDFQEKSSYSFLSGHWLLLEKKQRIEKSKY